MTRMSSSVPSLSEASNAIASINVPVVNTDLAISTDYLPPKVRN